MRLVMIGTGQMGQALLRGMLSKQILPAQEIYLYDADPDKAKSLSEELGCRFLPLITDAPETAAAILIAVKPPIVAVVLEQLRAGLTGHHLVLSIAAGISLADLRLHAGPDCALTRIMPNTPCMVGKGCSALCFAQTTAEQENFALSLFEACGMAMRVPEKLMDAVTGLSGSGPAYMMLAIEAMADGGVRMGLPRDLALKMAAMTMAGSAELVLQSGQHPAVLKDQVCSPAGTTIEGIHALESRGFRVALMDAISAATHKSQELGHPQPAGKTS